MKEGKGKNFFQFSLLTIYDNIVYNNNMTREFVFTATFNSCWKAMGLTDENLRELEQELLKNPQLGDVIEGTGGARKIRIKLGNHGKSGGARVIYLDVLLKEKLYFLFAYPKSVQENLTAEQKKAIKNIIEEIKKEA